MNHVRIHGDPFGEDEAASQLRSFLRLALGNGMRCSLSLSAVRTREGVPGERLVPLTDGVRDLHVPTALPPAEIELLLRAANQAVAATAPVVVFAPRAQRDDAGRMAGLEWPRAATVLVVKDQGTPADALERVRAEVRWAGCENPPHALTERELQPWLSLPRVGGNGPVVHVGGDFDSGTDLVLDAWFRHFAKPGQALRLVLPYADDGTVAQLRQRLERNGDGVVEIVRSAFEPCHARDAAAIVQPWRRLKSSRVLVLALASGRPLCASRFAATAALLGLEGACVPIGGRNVPDEAVEPAHFAPHPRAVAAAWTKATAAGQDAAMAMGARARQHVVEDLTGERPSAPPAPMAPRNRAARPVVVLEAPFFETSSSALLSIETARALVKNQNVDLRLVPVTPFRTDIAALRGRAPELVPLLTRNPGAVDLWLSSGWPVRAARPACHVHALRIDWEYGSLPLDLTPHVTQDADVVVVHSEHVYRTVTAAGRGAESVKVVPHGVDAAMHEHAPPNEDIVRWKQGRPAVLFCGGPIWRKGFDVFLRSVLAARAAGHDFCVVVKTIGLDQHYGRVHLGQLLDRFMKTPGTPPVLRIDADLSREELASVYTACDVMLHPYRGEGFCLPLLEARACGLPVIATANGGADGLLEGPGAIRIPSARCAVELPSAHVSQPWIIEPSPDDSGRLLGETLAALAARQKDARSFAPGIREIFSWARAAEAIERLAFDALGRNQRIVVPPVRAAEPTVTLSPVREAPVLEPLRT